MVKQNRNVMSFMDVLAHPYILRRRAARNRPVEIENGGEGITGWVANNRQSRIVYDVDDERSIYKPFFSGAKSELCVPLLDKDRHLVGVINVESVRTSAFSKNDQKRLEALADLVVVAIQNVQSNEQRMANERVAILNHIARSLFHRMNNHLGAANVWAKRIVEGSLDSADLANKIRLEISQALADRQRLRSWLDVLQPVDIQSTIRSSCVRTNIPANIKVQRSIPNDLPKVLGNQEQLVDSFYNLIKNSVDAMQNGGNLSINVISMSYDKQAWVVVQFIDNGVGILKEEQNKIFERGYTTKKDGETAHDGEGLWLTKTFIENLGGKITFESIPNKETKFTVLLPAC